MNVPNPTSQPPPIVANTLPSGSATVSATAVSSLIGYGTALLAAKYKIPFEVVGAALGVVFTGLTSLWHRIMPVKPMP